MGESMLFLVLLAGCVIYGIDRKRRERKGALRRAALWMEQSPAVPADMDAVQDWWRALADGKDGGVDDITWQDLDMDAIFTAMNHTASGVGEEQLYAILRNTRTLEDTLSRRRRWIEALRKDSPRRTQLIYALLRLGKGHSYDGVALLLGTAAVSIRGKSWMYGVLAALPWVLALGGFLWAPCWLAAAAALGGNLFIHFFTDKALMPHIAAVRHLARVVWTAQRLERDCPPGMEDAAERFHALGRALRPVLRWSNAMARQSQSDLDFLGEYLRIFCHADTIRFLSLIRFYQQHREILLEAYTLVGEVDACLALACWTGRQAVLCQPLFHEALSVQAKDVVHPLLEHPVPNSYDWDRCTLVTGSNASGKSTFTRAMALNCILAQTIGWCTAGSFALPRCRVMTSMALRDNLMGGESYFVVEIRSLKRILDALTDTLPTLCVIDEILRGTNTVERIAASAALLRYVQGRNCLVMAATHDQELTHLLKNYAQVHFREELTEQGMHFSYRLMQGPADTRNAIALLRQMGFPEQVLQEAEAAAEHSLSHE